MASDSPEPLAGEKGKDAMGDSFSLVLTPPTGAPVDPNGSTISINPPGALDFGNGAGPDQIVDDGGDVTLLIHKGTEFEAAGKVPRERIREFDQRLHAVEEKLKSAEDRHWRRTDPETTARVAQFQARVDTYRAQAAKARAAGDERKARDADKQAAQWEEWLKTAQGAVDG